MRESLIVVGKNSYIGRCFTEYTISQGYRVTALSSGDCNFLELQDVLNFFQGCDDVPHTVVFFAVVNKSVANTFQAFLDNIQIVRNLIEGQKLANIASIIYFSSVDVYGMSPSLPITEQSRVNPDTWYGLAKYACEWMLANSGEVKCPATILRIPGVYGRAPDDRSVIGRMVTTIRQERQVVVHGSGKALRDYVYVGDLCRLLQALIPLRHCGVLNVATGESRSVLEVAGIVGSVLQGDFEVVHAPADETRAFDLVFDNRALTALLPTFRFSGLNAGIRSYL